MKKIWLCLAAAAVLAAGIFVFRNTTKNDAAIKEILSIQEKNMGVKAGEFTINTRLRWDAQETKSGHDVRFYYEGSDFCYEDKTYFSFVGEEDVPEQVTRRTGKEMHIKKKNDSFDYSFEMEEPAALTDFFSFWEGMSRKNVESIETVTTEYEKTYLITFSEEYRRGNHSELENASSRLEAKTISITVSPDDFLTHIIYQTKGFVIMDVEDMSFEQETVIECNFSSQVS